MRRWCWLVNHDDGREERQTTITVSALQFVPVGINAVSPVRLTLLLKQHARAKCDKETSTTCVPPTRSLSSAMRGQLSTRRRSMRDDTL